MDHYWILETWGKEIIYVGPKAAANIKQLFLQGKDVDLGDRIVIFRNIKDFRESDRIWTDNKELPQGEIDSLNNLKPIYTKQGGIECVWVKKAVPRREYSINYAQLGYKILSQTDNQVLVAFRLPTHILPTTVSICSNEESEHLNKKTEAHVY